MTGLRTICCCALLLLSLVSSAGAEQLSICFFQCDATPPLGSPLCDGAVHGRPKQIVDPLSLRGVVLLGAGKPIVLCAVDWVGIGDGGYDAFRAGAGPGRRTPPSTGSQSTRLHQHDAPGCDFEAETLLAARGLSGAMFDVAFARETIRRAAEALRQSLAEPRPVTHLGVGVARVEKVASNRRVLGPDGNVKHVRYSADVDPEGRAAPEGVIDPRRAAGQLLERRQAGGRAELLRHASAELLRQGRRQLRLCRHGPRPARGGATRRAAHSLQRRLGQRGGRQVQRRRAGQPRRSWPGGWRPAWPRPGTAPSARRSPPATSIGASVDVRLPLRDMLEDQTPLVKLLDNSQAKTRDRVRAATDLVWAQRVKTGQPISLSCLRLGSADVLHMPGELFVEYQLAAEQMKPQATVCMAAYGDYGPGYIGTSIAYSQGGYETSYVSRVAPEVEGVLMGAMRELLK